MLFSNLLILAMGTVSAMSAPAPGPKGGPKSKQCDISKLDLVLPPTAAKTTGLAPAPKPATSVLLGVGYQNYTCSAEGTYVAAGAVADLFDLSCLSKDNKAFDNIEEKAYDQWVKTKGPRFDIKGCNAHDVPFVGYHFFQKYSTGSAPVWDLRTYLKTSTAYVVGALVNKVPAPDGNGENVPWLQLKGVEGSLVGLDSPIYRTETRGGVAPTICSAGSPPFKVKYTTKYWLYGGMTV